MGYYSPGVFIRADVMDRMPQGDDLTRTPRGQPVFGVRCQTVIFFVHGNPPLSVIGIYPQKKLFFLLPVLQTCLMTDSLDLIDQPAVNRIV